MPEAKEAVEITPSDVGTIILLDDAQVERALRGQLDASATIAIEDPQAVALSIIERILASEDADEVFQGQKAIGGRDALGRPFTLNGVRWHRSRFEAEEGKMQVPVFAVLDASFLDDGERVALTTGSLNVMAQAYQLGRLGELPCDVKIEEAAEQTAAGFHPQWLVRAKA